MPNAIDDTQELWALAPGEYMVSIGLFYRDADSPNEKKTIMRTDSLIQVYSQREARYYFNQVTDLRRRVKKLEKVAARLFNSEQQPNTTPPIKPS